MRNLVAEVLVFEKERKQEQSWNKLYLSHQILLCFMLKWSVYYQSPAWKHEMSGWLMSVEALQIVSLHAYANKNILRGHGAQCP